jgi:hypothetical protein
MLHGTASIRHNIIVLIVKISNYLLRQNIQYKLCSGCANSMALPPSGVILLC